MATPAYTNRLIHEKSPYLLQHAHNPVDWYPWGPEAFQAAKAADKPIFLSIGYATCHWCHVMENESFEDPELAKLLNEAFICIKVDREELPHVDSIYMEFAQALMGTAGGWPLNLVLTPDLKPFFAVTYLPPKSRQGQIGFDQFIQQIKQLWQGDEKLQLIEQADQLVETFAKAVQVAGDELPSEAQINRAVEAMLQLADPIFGGIKGEPKFPLGYQAEFLLFHAKSKEESRALFYVELTLDMMHRGGIYDHLGGGFSRYATDERWQIPHFEKMTYDNAILAKTYLEAWRLTKRPLFKQVAEETLEYMLREMRGSDGGFFSGQDADSGGHEGLFYTWTRSEIRALLPGEEGDLFCLYYGITEQGNFEGRNILHAAAPLEELLGGKKDLVQQVEEKLKGARSLLFKERMKRTAPLKDDKVLTCWNALMIEALAQAGASFNRPDFTEAAVKAAQLIRTELWKEGKLLRRLRQGEARFGGSFEDYAFLVRALITLFEKGQGAMWLEWAIELCDVMLDRFKAPKGAFYQTEEEIVVRKCEFYDGAEPSGNGVHCENLLRLFQLTHEETYLRQAEDILKATKSYMEMYPPGACYLLMALQRYLNLRAPTLVIALDENRSLEKEIKEWLAGIFSPHLEVVWKAGNELDKLLPDVREKTPLEGKTAIYICRQNLCEPALIDKDQIQTAILNL